MDIITTSINEAGKMLGLGRTSIYSLINAGKLETIKVGRRTLVKTESICRLVSSS